MGLIIQSVYTECLPSHPCTFELEQAFVLELILLLLILLESTIHDTTYHFKIFCILISIIANIHQRCSYMYIYTHGFD